MNAVAKTQTAEVANYGSSFLEIISKAARDPNVDIDKMEKLLQMQERIASRHAEQEFNQAMNAAAAR